MYPSQYWLAIRATQDVLKSIHEFPVQLYSRNQPTICYELFYKSNDISFVFSQFFGSPIYCDAGAVSTNLIILSIFISFINWFKIWKWIISFFLHLWNSIKNQCHKTFYIISIWWMCFLGIFRRSFDHILLTIFY